MKLVGNGSEKAKHHYRPSSGKPKHKPEKCFPLPLESIKHFFWPPRCEAGSETSIPQRRMPWRSLCEASESLEQQQASCPRHAKHKPAKMLPVTFGGHKTWNQYTATPNAVQELMRSFRKPRTAARFVPKAWKTQGRKKAEKMLPVIFGIHKTFLVASTLAARRGPKPVYRTPEQQQDSCQAKCRGGAHANCPNSSRIRAHVRA